MRTTRDNLIDLLFPLIISAILAGAMALGAWWLTG
jgi:hypothetical protein